MPHPNARLSLEERFWQKVQIIQDVTSCWPWLGATDGDQGYGRMKIPGTKKQKQTHIIAWEIANGCVPDGLMILHTCDNPPCCRNDGGNSHVYSGTHLENMRDARERHRHPSHQNGRWVYPPGRGRGERAAKAKLANYQYAIVHMFYQRDEWSYERLAKHFGVTKQAIYYILKHQKPIP